MVQDKPIDGVTTVHEAANVIMAGLLAIAFGFLVTESSGMNDIPRWPYVWREVAVAYFLCAFPVARCWESWVDRKTHSLVAASVAVAVLTAIWWGTLSLSKESPSQEASTLTLSAIRAGLAVVVATAALILSRCLQGLSSRRFHHRACNAWTENDRRLFPVLASVVFVVLVPNAFLESRQTYVQTKLVECLAQSRLGQAQRLAAQLRVSAPDLRLGEVTIRQLSAELDDRVRQIERQIATRISPTDEVLQRLERARLCAMLGRIEAVRKILQPLISADPSHAPSCVLLGTAYEWAEEWSTSLRWYFTARESLRPHHQSPIARPLLVQATKGIAFTQRKMGRQREAEAAYLQALELTPTADMHYLLAQFYEDGQQSTKALQHVRTAMEMDRPRYGAPGRDMIDKLVTQHFGCLSVFRRSNHE